MLSAGMKVWRFSCYAIYLFSLAVVKSLIFITSIYLHYLIVKDLLINDCEANIQP